MLEEGGGGGDCAHICFIMVPFENIKMRSYE
jgi:hypothetical protein